MDIKIHNYVLKPCTGSTKRFDIFEIVIRTQKKVKETDPDVTYEVEKDFAFGCLLDSALQIIIDDRLAQRKGVVTFEEYLKQYRAEKSEVTTILKQFINN